MTFRNGALLIVFISVILGPIPSACRAAIEDPDMRTIVEMYSADRQDLLREYGVPNSPIRASRFEQLYRAWEAKLV
ncbi:MAG TPA: hypothetical protein VKB78_06485, partial [Pirellulales bacterium]|nr:hypothetical protein [Pirellulales bacterium]